MYIIKPKVICETMHINLDFLCYHRQRQYWRLNYIKFYFYQYIIFVFYVLYKGFVFIRISNVVFNLSAFVILKI